MVEFVILCNVSVAIVCWLGVKKLGEIRIALAEFNQSVLLAEEHCREALSHAPEDILSVQQQADHLRRQYRQYAQWQEKWNQTGVTLWRGVKLLKLAQRKRKIL